MPQDRDEPDEDAPTPRHRPTVAEQRRHAKSYPLGLPILPEFDVDVEETEGTEDFGSPYDGPIIPTRRDAEAVRRANRDPDDPVRAIDISAMFRGFGRALLARIRAEHADTVRIVGRLRDAIEGTRDEPGLEKTVAGHGLVVGPARTAASWALRGTVAAVIVLGAFLYKRGSDEQRVIDEIQTLSRKVERMESQIDQLRTQSKDPRP